MSVYRNQRHETSNRGRLQEGSSGNFADQRRTVPPGPKEFWRDVIGSDLAIVPNSAAVVNRSKPSHVFAPPPDGVLPSRSFDAVYEDIIALTSYEKHAADVGTTAVQQSLLR